MFGWSVGAIGRLYQVWRDLAGRTSGRPARLMDCGWNVARQLLLEPHTSFKSRSRDRRPTPRGGGASSQASWIRAVQVRPRLSETSQPRRCDTKSSPGVKPSPKANTYWFRIRPQTESFVVVAPIESVMTRHVRP